MSSKYGEYKEYHTSLDNLKFISPDGLLQSYNLIKKTILSIEKNLIKNKEKYLTKNTLKRNLVSRNKQTLNLTDNGKKISDHITEKIMF